MKVNGIEIKPGMIFITDNGYTWVVFPTKDSLAIISYEEVKWYYLDNFLETYDNKIISIKDLSDTELGEGKVLWEKPKEVIITMDEIAKKFGLSVEQIKIIK